MSKIKFAWFKAKMDASRYRILFSIVLFSAIGYLIGIYLLYDDPERTESFNYLNKSLLLFFVPSAIIAGFSCNFVLLVLNKILPWKRFMLARFTVGYLASFIVAAITIIGANEIFQRVGFKPDFHYQFTDETIQLLLKLLVILSFILFVYNLLHMALYSYRLFFVNSLKIKKTKREQMDLHIQALKNQLTPHYLFNNLNTISSLLFTDKPLTDKYIRSFVNSCKFIMDNSRNVVITLSKELEFVKSYLFLMEIRFADMLKVEIDVAEPLKEWYLPPLSLQMLVENAIKHNTLKSGNLLVIKIYADEKNYLIVENNITEIPAPKNLGDPAFQNGKNKGTTQVGIKNIQSRYAYLTEREVMLEKNDKFMVKLPLIKTRSEVYEAKIA